MTKKYTYKTVLIFGANKGVFAEFPFDSIKEFGSLKPVRVNVNFDGIPFSMSLLPSGNNGHWLHVKKEIRKTIGKEEGDLISVSLQIDNSPKTVEVPEYLLWLLNEDKQMAKYFEKLPFSAKKFWIDYIQEPKKDDAKVVRINRLFKYLTEHYSGKK